MALGIRKIVLLPIIGITLLAANICFILLVQGCDVTSNEAGKYAPIHLADHGYWPDPEGNQAIDIFGKFNTQKEMASVLRLDNFI